MLERPSDVLAPIPTPFTSLPELPQSPVKPANTFDATVPISDYPPVIESLPLIIDPRSVENLSNMPAVNNVQEKSIHKYNRMKYKPY
jgi:hypothetical protein